MNTNQENIIKLNSRLQNFPVMMFALVMGLSGLSLVYLKASHFLGYPKFLSLAICYVDLAIFAFISLTYMLKAFKYPQNIKGEFAHPVRVNFFAAIAIAFLLISMIMRDLKWEYFIYFWYLGAAFEAFMTLYVISYWINKNVEIKHSNPAWLIPVVGNVIVPLGGIGYIDNGILFYFFSVGIFFWIILLAILLNRIIFHNQLAQKFMPTLFILLAPPAIGMVSYVKMTGHFDIFAQGLYNIALFFSLLLIFMVRNFTNLKFFISWWAFTFPLAAMSIASILAYNKTSLIFYKIVSHASIVITTLVVLYVSLHTIKHMMKKEICIAE